MMCDLLYLSALKKHTVFVLHWMATSNARFLYTRIGASNFRMNLSETSQLAALEQAETCKSVTIRDDCRPVACDCCLRAARELNRLEEMAPRSVCNSASAAVCIPTNKYLAVSDVTVLYHFCTFIVPRLLKLELFQKIRFMINQVYYAWSRLEFRAAAMFFFSSSFSCGILVRIYWTCSKSPWSS